MFLTLLLPSLVLVALIYKHLWHPYFLSPLSAIPNAHPTSPLSSRWITLRRHHTQDIHAISAAHRQRGPIVRLAPNELSVNSLAGLRTIYTGAFEKDAFYSAAFINFHTPNLVGMLHNPPHARQKRMLSNIYANSHLQNSRPMRVLSSHILWKRLFPILEGSADAGEAVNVLPLFQAVGMDFTSAFLFGLRGATRFVLKEREEWATWLDEYERFKVLSREERYLGFVERWCLDLCAKVQRTTPSMQERLPATEPVVFNQLKSCLEKSPDGRPLDLAIASELLDHLVAGHETTGITFTYIMWEMSQRPGLQAKLRDELDCLSVSLRYDEAKKVPETEGEIPPLSEIDRLPLLDAIVRETLRLHAPAPAPLPRVTPPEGTWLHGYQIPGGVKVSSSAYSLHRIEEVFPAPEEWMPARWVDVEEGKIHDMRRLFWAFGNGGRMCLGSNFALLEIKLVVAALYANFTTVVVEHGDMEQDMAFISLPKGRRLLVRFDRV
ncbi:cytochrome P450 [Aspergillus heteromorphus CBS 117.55]|uniref:Cytochrome P450 n=1 Tax=Aspergillus heteromorphus CBS 117.55 TaxID=1448321 RepID=A0A317VWY2_9EURO|nr:cytochrome P450 [Aspergillus heteromorphus CBS 117.55]PWY77408.1 cytochrome P450 [Aspergillus heteromorphus CBS 117.55]